MLRRRRPWRNLRRATGVRTLFSSFHHFRRRLAREILADAARQGVPICVFEGNERSAWACLALLVGIIPSALLWTPSLRPVRSRRQLLTYVIPLDPAVMLWDGLVSNLRANSEDELQALELTVQTKPRRRAS